LSIVFITSPAPIIGFIPFGIVVVLAFIDIFKFLTMSDEDFDIQYNSSRRRREQQKVEEAVLDSPSNAESNLIGCVVGLIIFFGVLGFHSCHSSYQKEEMRRQREHEDKMRESKAIRELNEDLFRLDQQRRREDLRLRFGN
jgi:hypothetical protein